MSHENEFDQREGEENEIGNSDSKRYQINQDGLIHDKTNNQKEEDYKLYDSFGFEKKNQSKNAQNDGSPSKVQQFNINNILNDDFGIPSNQNMPDENAQNGSFDQNSLNIVSPLKTPNQPA